MATHWHKAAWTIDNLERDLAEAVRTGCQMEEPCDGSLEKKGCGGGGCAWDYAQDVAEGLRILKAAQLPVEGEYCSYACRGATA
jgi:hypothetical protein